MRIAHIADTHLGYKYSVLPGRDEDFAKSWLYACRAIVDSSPDLILHAGDVFHTHRPDWKALTFFHQGLDILKKAGVPIFVIAGNHDTSGISTLHTVFTFTANVHPQVVATNEQIPSRTFVEELDVDVVLVPHRSLLNPLLDEHIRELAEQREGRYSLLVSHGSISRDEGPSEPGAVAIPHSITEYGWDYMAFGHLHQAQPYGQRGWYSGSTERCGWSDYPASPAWTLVEIGEDKSLRHTQMSVPYMQFIDLPDLDCAGLSPADVCMEIAQMLEQVVIPKERCHIRLKATNLTGSAKRPVEMLVRKTIGTVHPFAVLTINLDNPQYSFFENVDNSIKPELKSLTEMFQDFVQERNYEDKQFQEAFLEKGTFALNQTYEVEE